MEASNVVKRLGGRIVLDGVSINVSEGSIYVLAGPNGQARLH